MRTVLQRVSWVQTDDGVKIELVGKPVVYDFSPRQYSANWTIFALANFGRKRMHGLDAKTFDDDGKLIDHVLIYPPRIGEIRKNI